MGSGGGDIYVHICTCNRYYR